MRCLYLNLSLIIDFYLVRDEACFDKVIVEFIRKSSLAKEGSRYAVLKSINSLYLSLFTIKFQHCVSIDF